LFAALADAIFSVLGHGLLGEWRTGSDYGHRDLARDLRRVLNSLGECRGKQVRLVLMIDGIDHLDSYDSRTAQRLRRLFMTDLSDNLVMVAAAVDISKRWEREGSPWYNFFEEIELTALDPDDAERMIRGSVKGWLDFEAEAVDRIMTLTGCTPLRIEVHCGLLSERLHAQGRRTVSVADVDAVGAPETPRHTTSIEGRMDKPG
jgi:hypothetical protein